MSDKTAQGTISEQGQILQAFSRALDRETHTLITRPDLLWQQLYNRLQWEESTEGGYLCNFIQPEYDNRTKTDAKSWIHNQFKTKESKAYQMALTGHTTVVESCAFSPEGKLFVTASRDKTLRLWDVGTGIEKAVLQGHTSSVKHCTFSPDGRMIASASADKTIRFWDASTGKAMAVLTGHTSIVTSCVFSSDNRFLITSGHDKTVRVWDVAHASEKLVLRDIGQL